MGSITGDNLQFFFYIVVLILFVLLLSISSILGYVLALHRPRAYYVNPDRQPVVLWHDINAVNPTYDQLLTFLESDQTDKLQYIPGKFVCSNFAETLQHNATKAGYKCGWVAIDFIGGLPSHSCNVFYTVDRGLIFIDCDGTDAIVDISPRKMYQPQSLIDGTKYEPMGEVLKYRIFW